MSDRFDPKPSARPTGGRSGPGGGAEDPLAELARLVSGRSPLEPVPAPGGRQGVAPNGALAPLPSEADLARDLESELLNELQASFSTIPEIVGRPGQPSPAAASVQPPISPFPVFEPPPQQPAFQPTAPAAPPIAQASGTAPQVRSPAPTQPSSPELDLLDELGIPADMLFRPPQAPDSDVPRAPQMVPLPPAAAPRAEMTPRQPQPPQQPQKKRESLATRIARAAQGGEREQAAPVRTEPARAAQPPARQTVRPPQNQKPRPEANNPQFRPTLAPNPPAPESDAGLRAIPSRWDPPVAEPAGQAMPDLSRFAPLRNDGSDEPGQKRPPAEPDFVEEFPFATGEVPDFAPPAAQAADNTIPGYGDDEVPYPEDDFAYERRRSVFQSPFLIAAVLGIVAIGGAAAIVFRPDNAPETPPIIAADNTPTKVAPAVTGGNETDNPSKRIYDRVDPGTEVADSRLVVPGTDPIADIPPIPGGSAGDSPVSRVILEGGPGFDPPDDTSGGNMPMDLDRGTSAVESSADPESIGPKRVRTVIVRPDGTIVSSAASDDGIAPALPEIPPASETPPAPAADENPLLAENFGSDTPSAPPPPPVPSVPPASASIPDIPAPPPVSQAPIPRVQAPPPPTIVATTGASGGPLDMTPGGATQAPPGGNGGGFLVQVSSQRSEETAISTFRQLQRRYPSILGDRAPDIQRADLGQRGVYFRVRVGYPTRDAAIQMCESLKSAGGDCILATR